MCAASKRRITLRRCTAATAFAVCIVAIGFQPGVYHSHRLIDNVIDHQHTQFRRNEVDGDDKGLSAPHIGLCQFAICDGSVRAISDQIDAIVYNALGTRQGHEAIAEPQ